VSCRGGGGQYVLPFRGSDGMVVGLGQVDRWVVGCAELLVHVCVVGVAGEVILVGWVGASGLLLGWGLWWLLSLGLRSSPLVGTLWLQGLGVAGVVGVRGVHGDILLTGVYRGVVVACPPVLVCVSYCFADR